MSEWGFLDGRRYIIIDRDSKYAASFRAILKSSGLKIIRLPPFSPNLDSFAKRWVLSAKSEVLSRLVIFGEDGLQCALYEYAELFHEERNHRSKDNVLLFPRRDHANDVGEVTCTERLGGLLKYCYREAARSAQMRLR